MVCALRRRQRHGKTAKDRPPTKTEQLDGTFSWDYAASRRRLANDEDLRLGLNCCAVCAGAPLLSCDACGRIVYCSARCRALDGRAHRRACGTLRTVPPERLEDMGVEEDVDEAAADLGDVATLPTTNLANWRDPTAALAMSFPLSAAWAAAEFPRVARAPRTKRLTIHVLGAAPPECAAPPQWWAAALGRPVTVVLVGPQATARPDREKDGARLLYRRGAYENATLPPASLILGFNMGITDEAYGWRPALAAAPRGVPLVTFAHSRLEAARERRCLRRDHGAVGFSVLRANPFHAPRWKQSGVVANDVYRKHSHAQCCVLDLL